jgi:hypothetical protein
MMSLLLVLVLVLFLLLGGSQACFPHGADCVDAAVRGDGTNPPADGAAVDAINT